MKEPGLDNRHRDRGRPKAGEIEQKRSDTLNENLSRPVREFGPRVTVGKMRQETGRRSLKDIGRAARSLGNRP
jgi:hypothetical protein